MEDRLNLDHTVGAERSTELQMLFPLQEQPNIRYSPFEFSII